LLEAELDKGAAVLLLPAVRCAERAIHMFLQEPYGLAVLWVLRWQTDICRTVWISRSVEVRSRDVEHGELDPLLRHRITAERSVAW
jgi:hypothetical protein